MKIDVSTIFFNSNIDGGTATAPWCVSIGQGKDKKINNDIPGLNDVLDGLIYKSVYNRNWVDTSAGSKNNEYLLVSKFDKIFINGVQQDSLNLIGFLVREHTKSHEGRLRISFPPYASYNDGVTKFTNQDTYQAISEILGCGKIDGSGGCWFVDDISVLNQDELYLSCIVVDPNRPKIYKTSQSRSSEWQSLSSDRPDYEITRLPKIFEAPIIDEPLQVIYYGAPGTGKSFTIDDKTDDINSVRTTFHPDSDYASFVGAYKPTMENVPINSIYGESVQFATGKNGHPGTEKKIVYKYVPQAFLKAYVAAWSNLDRPYFLIIEEINRGNCAQIFGDLFQLLDRNNAGSSSYAIHADEDISQFLNGDDKGFASLSDEQKEAIRSFTLEKDNGKTQAIGQDILDGKLLLLPPNLYIWATMNTSDQSLFPIDSAFKRRWNWKYMPIVYRPLDKKTQQPIDWKFKIGDNLYSWGQFLSKINPEIYSLTESSDKQMGYFFAKADNATGIISEDVFLNKVLFYLWTDVFKDFDVSSELFKNKKANRSFRFTDFFEDSDALGNFIDNFGLEPIDNLEEDLDDSDETTDSDDSQTKKGPSKTFVIRMEDGTLISSKKAKDALIDFVKYAGLEKVRDLNIVSHNNTPFISMESDPGFETWKKRYKHPIQGTDYYINSAWSVEDMLNKLVTRIANDLDLHIISKKIILQSEYNDETTD